MPRTRKRASSPVEAPEPELQQVDEEEEEEEEEQEDAAQPIRFDETLTWRAGKPIPVAELLRRLKTLHAELLEIQQEDAHRGSLIPVAQELAQSNLLTHRERSVKAWVASCLVEMLRLLAPDAPFKGSQLKDIFALFINTTIPALGNPSDSFNDQHLRVLTSLDDVKSIVLLTDIPGSDGLLAQLFQACFDILADTSRSDTGEELSKNVEYHMTRMLITLVDEGSGMPPVVVDTILAQFLRVDPSTFPLQVKKSSRQDDKRGMMQIRQLPPAYNMAKNICSSCPEKMSRAISQYFSTVIVDASENTRSNRPKKSTGKRRRGSEDSDDEDLTVPAGPTEDDLKELHKAHRLLRELWRSAPSVIQNIIPHLDAELVAENVSIRLLATETIGDLISGIGAAGPPAPAVLDPSGYPSQSLESAPSRPIDYNFLTTPASPHAFSSVHSAAHRNFLNRRKDPSAQVRAAWTNRAGLIITTSAGGVGLDHEEEANLLEYMADMLVDQDERVRLAAVQVIARCDFDTIVSRFGAHGGIADAGSILCNLADRIKDRKHHVRTEAMSLLGRLWGVAAGAIAEGSDRVRSLLGPIPSRIFEAVYVNDNEINKLVNQVSFDSLLPMNYPPIKNKPQANGDSQRIRDSQNGTTHVEKGLDADAIRAERILVLTRDLEPKSKTVFFALQKRQVGSAAYLEAFIKRCEEYNGGVTGKDGKEAKNLLGKLVDFLVKAHPEPMTASDALWKFAKKHDRRCYQLIRFATSPESDYKRVRNSIKELSKRIEESGGNPAGIIATLIPIVQQSSVIVYNRSHVPTVMEFARTDNKGLGTAAHEVLKEISENHPEVFKAHVKTMCETLVQGAPKAGAMSDPGTVETLKACSGFAQRFPSEMPQDREFLKAMVRFAVHGNPAAAAKHAVSVIVAIEDKKDMYIKDILTQCLSNFTYGSDGFLSKLAALSQLSLLAAKDLEDESDNIMAVAVQQVLLQTRVPATDEDPQWQDDMDDDCAAKVWALKILVNRLRCYANSSSSAEMASSTTEMAKPVYKLLETIIRKEGELSKTNATPAHHKSRLRLTAGILLLKLSCSSKHFDHLLTAQNFNELAPMTQDALPEVRSTFVDAVKKYLGQSRLPARFYAFVFLLAFEPRESTKNGTMTWLRARSAGFAAAGENVMELTFARFLSLLAHHPDFSMDAGELKDFVEYIMFYLKTVATKSNIGLIYHVAQRIKSVQDGINTDANDNLYCLSDIAQATIREYADIQNYPLPAWSGKMGMPSGLFASLPSHEVAQDIADKQYAPEELMDKIDDIVRSSLKTKKRKSETPNNQAKKRSKTSESKVHKVKAVKTPKRKPVRDHENGAPSTERRRSTRASNAKNYAGMDDSDEAEDVEMEDVADDEEDKENVEMAHPVIAKRGSRQNSTTPAARSTRRKANGTDSSKTVMDISDDSDEDEDVSDAPDTDDNAIEASDLI